MLILVVHVHYLYLLVALDSVANQLSAGWCTISVSDDFVE